MKTYIIELSDAQEMSLAYVAYLPEDWIKNAITERCRNAQDEIVKICVEKCIETNTPIPNSKDEMVVLAYEKGWVKTAKQIADEQAELEVKNDAGTI